MNLAELQARQGNVDITATVTEVSEPRTFEKFGKAGKVANARIKDDSGEMSLTLWNEQVDQVKVGDTIKLTNGYVREWQGQLQLSTGKFGKLEVVEGEPSSPPEIPPTAEEDISVPEDHEEPVTEEVVKEEKVE